MAAVSFSLCLGNNSFSYKSGNGLPLCPKPFPASSRVHRRRNSVAHIANKELTKATEEVARRSNDHHSNLWDYDFIQSLPKPYEAPPYVERSWTLVKDVKEMFNAMEINSSCDDLFDKLSLVDNVERLGIDRYFQSEIKGALDYVYRYWNEKGIGRGRDSPCADLNTTALGLRILRLHRYKVSSDVLECFKGKEGQFFSFTSQSEEVIKCAVNLYRASLLSFPWETVLGEAKDFTTKYLKDVLPKIESSSLSQEIQFNLDYDWHANGERLEARNYIEIYNEDRSWAEKRINEMSHMKNKKLLDLAKLDFNMMQSLQQRELQITGRWWLESGLCNLSYSRHRYVEYYLMGAAVCGEPKYWAFRIGVAKFSALATYLDDMYDTYGTLDELHLFTDAIKRWDPRAADGFPEYMKIIYLALNDAVNEMAREAEKTQGRDTLDHGRKACEDLINSYMQEAEWIAARYIPTLEEYLENGKVSSALRFLSFQPMLTVDARFPENMLAEFYHQSKFYDLLSKVFRFRGDIQTFKVEASRGEIASSITSYMRDHPGSSEEDALNHLNAMVEEGFKEFNWEYLKPGGDVPAESMEYVHAVSRALQLFYRERDGFSITTYDVKNHVDKLLLQPVPL